MKPARFEYFRPSTVAEAIEVLARFDGDARVLAGGQSLIPLLNFRVMTPAALIDLGRCDDLEYVRRDGNMLACGPMTRQSTVEDSKLFRTCCPLVSLTMQFVGSRTTRNRGTIGGTLAHADRIAELPAVAVALGAQMIAEGPAGRRAIAAEEFFVGDLTTDLGSDEILREIRFPVASSNSRFSFVEATNRHHDLALVGIAVNLQLAMHRFDHAAIAVHGTGSTLKGLTAVEETLLGQKVNDDTIRAAAGLSLKGIEPQGDNNATAMYRGHILPGLVERALMDALLRTPETHND